MTKSTRRKRFLHKLTESGWGNTEAARHLRVSPNYVYMVRYKNSKPSASLLELLELKVEAKETLFITEAIGVLPEKECEQMLGTLRFVAKAFAERHRQSQV